MIGAHRWPDKSGAGLHALQPNADQRPTLYEGPESRLPSVYQLPGPLDDLKSLTTQRWMALAGFEGSFEQPAWTALVAIKVDRRTKHGTVLLTSKPNSSSRVGFRFVDKCEDPPCLEFKARTHDVGDIRTSHPVGPDWEIWEFVHLDGTMRLLVGGEERGVGPFDLSEPLDHTVATLGGRPHRSQGAKECLQGHLGEGLFYDRALTDDERNRVRAYLTAKWEPTGVFPTVKRQKGTPKPGKATPRRRKN